MQKRQLRYKQLFSLSCLRRLEVRISPSTEDMGSEAGRPSGAAYGRKLVAGSEFSFISITSVIRC